MSIYDIIYHFQEHIHFSQIINRTLSIRIFKVSLQDVKRFSQFAKKYLLYKIILMTLLFHFIKNRIIKSQKIRKNEIPRRILLNI